MNRIVELTPNQNTLAGKYRAGDIVLVKCNALTSAFSIQLPDAKSVRDIILYIKKTDSSSNAITLTLQDAQTIDGATSVTVNSQYDSLGLISDYSNYHKIDFFVDEGDYLLRDGSRELTADWDAGAFTITSNQFNAGSITAGTLSLTSGSITDSSGSISFGNENLTTTGSITAEEFVSDTYDKGFVTGATNKGRISHDGTDFIFNSQEVGSGDYSFLGGSLGLGRAPVNSPGALAYEAYTETQTCFLGLIANNADKWAGFAFLADGSREFLGAQYGSNFPGTLLGINRASTAAFTTGSDTEALFVIANRVSAPLYLGSGATLTATCDGSVATGDGLARFCVGTTSGKGARGKVHIANGTNANTNWFAYSPLVVESNTFNEINIRTPNNVHSGILCSEPSAQFQGGLLYNHNPTPANGYWDIYVNQAITLSVKKLSMLVNTNKILNFRDTGIGIYSQADSYLDLFADGAVRIGDSSGRAPTNYLSIESDGDIVYVGGSGIPYGSLYLHEGAQNIDISSVGQGVYVKITGFDTGETHNVTINSDAFNVDYVGVYKIDWQVSGDSQGNNKDYEIDIFVNGVEQSDGSSRQEFGSVGSLGSMNGTAIIDITDTAHDIDLRMKEVGAGAGTDFDIFNMSFNITQVGGT